jgi:hypothetical protein
VISQVWLPSQVAPIELMTMWRSVSVRPTKSNADRTMQQYAQFGF